MNGYLLDTNIVSHYFSKHVHVLAKITSLPDRDLLFISAITLGEIAFGHAITQSTNPEKRAEFERFVRDEFTGTAVLAITRHTMSYYGDIKAALFTKSPPRGKKENHPERCIDRVTGAELGIDENDLWIAAQAIERNLVLVTNDEMLKIREAAAPLLDVEDWTKPT